MADDSPSTLKWSGNLDISQAFNVHQELGDALDRGVAIELDAEDVERVDTAIVQLLCVFFREARERSIDVRWKLVSEKLSKVARALDLGSAISLADDSSVAKES